MKNFVIRTSYAGIANPRRDIVSSERIAKRFDYSVRFVADKGVGMAMSGNVFTQFKRAMEDARLGYLIEESE